MRRNLYHARLRRFASAAVRGSAFGFRPPATGKSKARWRRSAGALVGFFRRGMVPVEAASLARLRFKAAIRSITGVGGGASRGFMGRPLIFASISSRNAF
jgi:hypothetical protein